MRLDFNVLWVDDQPDRVRSQITAIAKKMAEEGFEFAPRLCKSIAEVQGEIANHVFTDEIDLVLVDWDLGGGAAGQDVIAQIRESVQFKDVVFYSAQATPDDLRKLAYDKGLEGIYCASREQLVEEVVGVFESLVKKVLDLDHTRGIVMAATSDIDHIVNQCIILADQQLDTAGKNKMLKDALKYVKERIETISAMTAELESATTLDKFFAAHMILTANDRLRILAGVLKHPKFSAQKPYRAAVTQYQQRVIQGRNQLGHMVLVPEGKPRTIVTDSGKRIGLDETRILRRQILELRSKFRGLFDALQSMSSSDDSATSSTTKKIN